MSVYTIESVIGEGGMGVVYRAWDGAMQRPVALKCLHANLAGDPEIRRRFAREARLLRDYQHSNVIQVYDFVEVDYIVMELSATAGFVARDRRKRSGSIASWMRWAGPELCGRSRRIGALCELLRSAPFTP